VIALACLFSWRHDSELVKLGVIVAVLGDGVRDGDGASRKPEKHSKYPAGHITVPTACCTHVAEAVLVPIQLGCMAGSTGSCAQCAGRACALCYPRWTNR
jgi:hypothetical protein